MAASLLGPVLAASLVAVAVLLVLPLSARLAPRSPPGTAVVVGLVAAAGLIGTLLGVSGRVVVLVLIGAGALTGVRRLQVRQREARTRSDASARVMEACEAVAAELAAGRPPSVALRDVALDFPELAPVAGAAALGADVPATLRELAAAPGRQELRLVAAAWQVGLRSGASLADPIERVAGVVRERRRTARLVAGELAAAQATARIMAALPVVFLVAGSGLGGDPWGFLSATPVGLACLSVGLLLSYCGLAWLQRIALRVERSP